MSIWRRRPARTAQICVALAIAASTASACAVLSPTTMTTPYAASDGTNGEIAGADGASVVALRNMLVVAAEEGGPGLLLGALTTDGTEPVDVALTVSGAGSVLLTESFTVEPSTLTVLGEGGTEVAIDEVDSAPGTVITLNATTASGGVTLNLPVLAPEDSYAGYAAELSAPADPSVSVSTAAAGSASVSASASASASATADATD